MLQKFVTLKNIGRFANCSAKGDVDLRRLTLIYGGNGQGKTTLCAIIRSLQSGDPSYLLERRTRGQQDDPSARVLTDQGVLKYSADAWDSVCQNVSVYDNEFVHDNVYAGEYVDHEHKKRLYRVMIGEQGVQLARKVDALDDDSRAVAKEIRQAKQVVQAFVPDGINLNEFLDLKPVERVDEVIAAKSSEVDALQRAAEIRDKRLLDKIQLPEFPSTLESLLARQLEDVAGDVELQIQSHIEAHTNGVSPSWLEQGVSFLRLDTCPFCGQATNEVSLVRSYGIMFGDAYGSLKEDVAALASNLSGSLGEAALLKSDATQSNASLLDFWQRFTTCKLPELDFESEVHRPIRDLAEKALALVERKSAAPLEKVEIDDEFGRLEQSARIAREKVQEYNAAVDVANALIQKQKAATETGNLQAELRTLSRLNAAKVRHQEDATAACEAYQEALTRKQQIEDDKGTAKQDLDQYGQQVFGQYKARINELLERFGADFRIGDIKPRYVGGHPSSSYPVVINEEQVDVGDDKTPRGTPAFRSTLSAGDRSSLALAFFIAQLEKVPSLSDRIIVFDDPFTSQDRSRRSYTQQLICRKTRDAKQVIVTSHDPHFLKAIWDSYPTGSEIRTLQLARTGGTGTTIAEWDIEKETRNEYLRELSHLQSFLSEGHPGDLRDVARKIRPVLEGHLRLRIPHQFLDDEWLGDFIGKIRGADAGSPLSQWQGDPLEEITDINDYSKKYHHKQNPAGADTEPIDEGELRAYVQRTLKFVGSI